ncbi:cytochrome P450, partial [Nocardia gipuzkoensis]
ADGAAGMSVRAGAAIVLSPSVIHRQSDLWRRPDVFRPDRFLAETHMRSAYLPFGHGRAGRIAQDYAVLRATLVLATIAQTYRLELPVGAPGDPAGPIRVRTLLR